MNYQVSHESVSRTLCGLVRGAGRRPRARAAGGSRSDYSITVYSLLYTYLVQYSSIHIYLQYTHYSRARHHF